MEAILEGRIAAAELLGSAEARPSWASAGPRVPTEIHVDNQASSWCTVIDVYTRDRPYLLYTIARALHEAGLSIALAKVNTEGHRVADVFYVRTAAGGKLQGPGELSAVSNALHEAIRRRDVASKSA
jgi:[protein-PII] uridylyltransferase